MSAFLMYNSLKIYFPSMHLTEEPDFVSVWQIKDGSLVNIKDVRTHTIGKHYFNDVMNDMLDDYYLMLPFVEITKS